MSDNEQWPGNRKSKEAAGEQTVAVESDERFWV
jgi:hypothetical protein